MHDQPDDPSIIASRHGLAALLRGWWLRVEATGQDRCHATLGGPGLRAVCTTLSRAAATAVWIIDGTTCASPEALTLRLQRGWPPRELILVDGVVELCDVEAVSSAIEGGQSPFDVECRTLIHLRTGEDTMHIEAADPEALDTVAAALLRSHVARCLHVSPDAVVEPPLDVVIHAREGADMLLRPIETQVMSTSVDVGLARTDNAPAPTTLIYDRTTKTWHTD